MNDAAEIVLNPSQSKAKSEIEASIIMRRAHLVTGEAGTGKTVLMQEVAKEQHTGVPGPPARRPLKVVATAPTHKACAVLARKLKLIGIDIPVRTIHSLLSLRPKAQGDKQVFVRAPRAKAVTEDIIIIDECSMLDSSMMDHIDRHLSGRAVIFCGDPGQLPPVGEKESRSFATTPASHLDTIVRQAVGNPIIACAHIIRESQARGELDWSWCQEVRVGNFGVFAPPRGTMDIWLRRSFVDCGEFQKDADFSRYLCWTNARVAEINSKLRRWMRPDADPAIPFARDEVALMRSPLVIEDQILIATNEEVRVLDIVSSSQFNIATWGMKVVTENGMEHDIHLPRDWDGYRIALGEMADDAKVEPSLWENYHEFKAAFMTAQQCMALTIHNSQGSTFKFAFLDISDVRKRIRDNMLEAQQLFYTGATRPSDGLVLVGV